MRNRYLVSILLLGSLIGSPLFERCSDRLVREAEKAIVRGIYSMNTPEIRPEPVDVQLALPAPLSHVPEQILRRKAYVLSFNTETLLPNWVAWRLTAEAVDGHVKRESVSFHEDFNVAPRYRVIPSDYSRSGYDRGHMCPAGDNKWSFQAMEESFLMTNICPQLHSLNAGDWNNLEIQCRAWAREYGEIYIVCGPIV